MIEVHETAHIQSMLLDQLMCISIPLKPSSHSKCLRKPFENFFTDVSVVTASGN